MIKIAKTALPIVFTNRSPLASIPKAMSLVSHPQKAYHKIGCAIC